MRQPVDVHRPHDHAEAEQRLVHARAVSDVDQEEVRPARHVRPPETLAGGAQEGEPLAVVGAGALHVLGVVERRERRHLRERVHVERLADAVQDLDELERPDAVADAQPREAVDLRERAQREEQPSAPLVRKRVRDSPDPRRSRRTRRRRRPRRAAAPTRGSPPTRRACRSSPSGCSGWRGRRGASAAPIACAIASRSCV